MSLFASGEIVWAKNAFRRNIYWPAIVVNPERDAPTSLRKTAVNGRVCLMFYGPSSKSVRYCTSVVHAERDIMPWEENFEAMQVPPPTLFRHKHSTRMICYQQQEMNRKEISCFRAAVMETQEIVRRKDRRVHLETAGETTAPSPGPLSATASDPVRRVCTVCQRVLGDELTTIACSKCGERTHVECDTLATVSSRAISLHHSYTYFCPRCRPGMNIAERGHFAADTSRELNCMQKLEASNAVHTPIKREAEIEEKQPSDAGTTPSLQREYRNQLHQWNSPNPSASHETPRNKIIKMTMLQKRSSVKTPESVGKVKFLSPKIECGCDVSVVDRGMSVGTGSLKLKSVGASPTAQSLPSLDQLQLPKEIPVECNSIPGTFYFGAQKVKCECTECNEKPELNRIYTATHFEQHCGAGSAKKWKSSVRIRPGGVPEVSLTDPPLPLGRWFVMKGIDELVTRVPVSSRRKEGSRAAKRQSPFTEPRFDEFERSHRSEARPWDQVRIGGYRKIHVKYAGDRCNVCDADVDYDCDQLISCDKCGITVHQTCYGVHEKVSSDQIWLCNVCRAQGTENAECCLCPIVEGARKPTTIPGLWCHVACMQWIPEVTVLTPMKMEPVSRIECIQKERWELNCCFCKQKMGAKIQCSACYTSYHPLCARIAGMHMEMRDGPQGSAGPLDLVTFCPRHAPPHPELSGIKLVYDKENESMKPLSNRQPYEEALAVSIPAPKEGCARAQPLVDWDRKCHGSGSGHESIKAFWIPLKPTMDDFGNFVNTDGTPIDPSIMPRFRKRKFKNQHQKSCRSKAMRIGEHDADEPIQPVELIPLPEGATEKVHVECNNIRGIFHLRSQKVFHQGILVPAARFECLCGRGDAKKWKSSLWFVNAETNTADVQMSVWLFKVGLDRKNLLALRDNYHDYEAYVAHLTAQIKRVIDSVIDQVIEDTRESKDEDVETIIEEEMEKNEEEEGRADVYIQGAMDALMDDIIQDGMPLTEQMSVSEMSPSKADDRLETSAIRNEDEREVEDESVREDMKSDDEGELQMAPVEFVIGQGVRLNAGEVEIRGVIEQFSQEQGEYRIRFDDDREEWMELDRDEAVWNEKEWVIDRKSRNEAPIEATQIHLPEQIEVFCKEFRATFLVQEKMIVSDQGLKMTPREFERAAGKGAAKKWKNSIKVCRPDGKGAMTLGEWLIRNGVIPDAEGRFNQNRALSRTNFSTRARSRTSSGMWIVQKHRRQRHPLGCQCVVCSQSRRRASQCNLTGRMEVDDPNRVEKWQPATTIAALRAHGPGIRYGKRAYVRAVPQTVGGVVRHQPHEIPKSKCWNVHDWIRQIQNRQSEVETPNTEVIRKTDKWRIHLARCNATQDERVTFGKSGIHGWGLFAMVSHEQDEMIIEYKGEIVTPAVADMREKHYRENEKDCYLFHVNDSFIIDATVKGSIARFINHCCEPCMYCKDIQLDGRNHLCFFARYDIKAGQELTYDYRFKEELEEHKLVCNCGAPNCRGFLN